jgi:hypothetical protein
MKNLIISSILTMVLLNSCYTYRPLIVPDTVTVIKTYKVIGTKDELFRKANLWMVSTFKDARSVILNSDRVEGILTGKYLLKFIAPSSILFGSFCWATSEEAVYAIIEIRVKNGIGYISITPDYSWQDSQVYDPSGHEIPMNNVYTRKMAINDINSLCESFYKSLQREEINSKFVMRTF